MSRIRSVASRSPAIIISLIALTFSLGSGAGYAASVAASHPAAAKVSFHSLALLHGWMPAAPAFHDNVGNPAYAVSNGVVYLTGALHQTSGSNTEFARLPKSARPRHTLWIGVYSEAAADTQSLEIESNGNMFMLGPDASYFSSLAGISFPLTS